MISSEKAVQELIDACKGRYISEPSYSTVKNFTLAFPKKKTPMFVLDGLPKQIGTGTRTRT